VRPMVLVLSSVRIHEDALAMLRGVAEVRLAHLRAGLPGELREAEAVMLDGEVRVDEEFLKAAPRLKIAARVGVGYDRIDVEACTRRGVYVTITPNTLSGAVADLTMGLILCLARPIVEADRYVREGWGRPGTVRHPPLGVDLEGKTLGIIGLGRIGSEVARRAQGFGMRVLYHDIARRRDAERRLGVRYVALEGLLREADFVTLHVPLKEDTRGLIGRRELGLMKPTAFLVNTSRGEVVDQEALTEFLREGRIAGAGLDVFTREPVPLGDPILKLSNVVLTPHMGSATAETRRRMALRCAEDVLRALRGQTPTHLVPEQAQRPMHGQADTDTGVPPS